MTQTPINPTTPAALARYQLRAAADRERMIREATRQYREAALERDTSHADPR
jgi:hypothetical protein